MNTSSSSTSPKLDYKTQYIIHTLSRTKRKDYENYVVNAIWNRLNLPDLKPMSQAYVPSNKYNDKYYLIDLFFPQLSIGIECDEEYHKDNINPDRYRELDIQEMFHRVNSDCKILRVKAYDCDYDTFNNNISEVVNTIKQEYEKLKQQGKFEEWEQNEIKILETAKNKIYQQGYISNTDDIVFPTLADACNTIFGSNYKMVQRGFFYPNTARGKNEDFVLWAPRLATKVDETTNSFKAAGKYKNILSANGESIHESTKGRSMRIKKHDTKSRKPRITFGYVKDPITRKGGWKFIGKYKYKESKNGANTYKKTSDIFGIIR